jgi:nicotinamidase-related amidase
LHADTRGRFSDQLLKACPIATALRDKHRIPAMARTTTHHGTTHNARETPIAIPASGTALLLIDVINDLAFDGSEALVSHAESMATALARLKRRATAAGLPTIYVNDNFGQWRSDFRRTVAHCTARSSPGRDVSQRLRPTARDYFVLKPKHSGFFDTTLDSLLEALRIRRVILTGIAGNICVLFTANDAYMREFKIFAPADCIVSNTVPDNDHALRQIKTVMKGNIALSTRLTFQASRRGPKARNV